MMELTAVLATLVMVTLINTVGNYYGTKAHSAKLDKQNDIQAILSKTVEIAIKEQSTLLQTVMMGLVLRNAEEFKGYVDEMNEEKALLNQVPGQEVPPPFVSRRKKVKSAAVQGRYTPDEGTNILMS